MGRDAAAPPLTFVVGGFGTGGTERHLSLVLPALARRGWPIQVAMLSGDGPMSRPVREAGIAVTAIDDQPPLAIPRLGGLLGLVRQVAALRRHLAANRPALVHAFLPTPCIVAWLASTGNGGWPLVMSKRSQMIRPVAFPFDKALEIRALRRASHVLAHSRAVADELAAFGLRPELIHNGIDLAAFTAPVNRRAVRRREGWPEQGLVLAVLANLIPYKGHADLLRALALHPPAGDWRLVCVGSGPAAPLAALAGELGLAGRVIFAGGRDDVAPLLGAADIGVLPSHHEGFSNALLEYMAAGLPVIATAVGGNPDAVAEGETGLLVPPHAPEALSAALHRLDEPARRAMGARGRARVHALFDLDACADRYDAFYRRALQRAAVARAESQSPGQ